MLKVVSITRPNGRREKASGPTWEMCYLTGPIRNCLLKQSVEAEV